MSSHKHPPLAGCGGIVAWFVIGMVLLCLIGGPLLTGFADALNAAGNFMGEPREQR